MSHASRTTTVGCTPNAAAEAAEPADTNVLFVTTTFDGEPAVIDTELLATVNGPDMVKVISLEPAVPVIERSVKVAMPLTAATEVVPRKVRSDPEIDAVTVAVDVVTVLP